MLLSVPGKVLNRIILERLKNEVDNILRDHQAGLRQDRSCIYQIATVRIIVVVERMVTAHNSEGS